MNPLILIYLGIIKPTPEILKVAEEMAEAQKKMADRIDKMSEEEFGKMLGYLFKSEHEIYAEKRYNSLYKM